MWKKTLPTDAKSVLERGITFKGEVHGEGELWILGRIEGTVTLTGTVHVAEGGEVEGQIHAPQIIIAGQVVGDLLASEKIEFLPTGSLNGHLRTNRLIVAEGALMNGTIMAGGPEVSTAAPDLQPVSLTP